MLQTIHIVTQWLSSNSYPVNVELLVIHASLITDLPSVINTRYLLHFNTHVLCTSQAPKSNILCCINANSEINLDKLWKQFHFAYVHKFWSLYINLLYIKKQIGALSYMQNSQICKQKVLSNIGLAAISLSHG